MGIVLAVAFALSGCGRQSAQTETEVQTETVAQGETAQNMIGTVESQSPAESETEPGSETAAPETDASGSGEGISLQMYASYAQIVSRYQNALEDLKNNGMPEQTPDGVNPEFLASLSLSSAVLPETVGFQLYDLNTDGIPELFVGMNYDEPNEDLFVYDVYTWSDGQAMQLMDDIGYRAGTCEICEGGIIKDEYSSSAADSGIDFHRLPAGGKALETVERISAHGDIESGVMRYYRDAEGNAANEISEDEYDRIEDQYEEIDDLSSYPATEENRSLLEQGKLEQCRSNVYGNTAQNGRNDGHHDWNDEHYNWDDEHHDWDDGYEDHHDIDGAGEAFFDELDDLEDYEEDLLEDAMDTVSINQALETVYEMWDQKLNIIYQTLKSGMSEEEANQLIDEEETWIADRDAQADAAWNEFVDQETGSVGTGATAAMIGTQKELTKQRVYELAYRVYGYHD